MPYEKVVSIARLRISHVEYVVDTNNGYRNLPGRY